MKELRIVWMMTALFMRCELNAQPSHAASQGTDRPRNGLLELSLKDARSELSSLRSGPVGVILVVIKNISSAQLSIDITYSEFDFPVVVLDESGQQVPRTEHGKGIAEQLKHGIFVGRIKSRKLYPDDVYEEKFDLTRLYELKPGHTYKVRVETKMGPLQDHAQNPVDRHLSRTMNLVIPQVEP